MTISSLFVARLPRPSRAPSNVAIGNIEKAFLGKFAGVHLDHSEEIKDKMGVLSVLLGGASVTKAILGQFSLAPDELLEILVGLLQDDRLVDLRQHEQENHRTETATDAVEE